jgi:hypothetical protein
MLQAAGANGRITRPNVAQFDVVTVYGALSSVPIAERKIVYQSLAPEAKAALWRHQLEQFKAETTLSAAQTDLVDDAAALATPHLFSIKPTSPEWEAEAREPMQVLERRARALFPPEMIAATFGRLGPDDSTSSMAPITPSAGLITPSLPANCTCTQENDGCWFGTCGGGVCYQTDGGCGWWWQYDCVAVCHR